MSQQSDIEKAVDHYNKLYGTLVDYPMEQPNKTLLEIDIDYMYRIASADKIVAVPKPDGSFGESVTYEMAFAKFLGKDVGVYYPV